MGLVMFGESVGEILRKEKITEITHKTYNTLRGIRNKFK